MKRVVKSDALEERLRVAAHTDGDISITCISGFLSYTAVTLPMVCLRYGCTECYEIQRILAPVMTYNVDRGLSIACRVSFAKEDFWS